MKACVGIMVVGRTAGCAEGLEMLVKVGASAVEGKDTLEMLAGRKMSSATSVARRDT